MKFSPSALIALMTVAGIAHAQDALPLDPNNTYGTLDSGMKYIIRHSSNPPGRVNCYLHIKTGAINETDAQNGIAHFLEHMAFNGSTHFPPGKLIPLLGSLGMTFGADTNAHTNLWETLYKLNLPNTQPKTIDLGLQILSDYASGLQLSDEEIDEERNIILEEYRTREGVGNRIGKMVRRDLYAGTKLAKHDVIGDPELIKTFPRAEFRKYYDQWYRPENMTLIVVGDVTADDVMPSIKKWLAGVGPRMPATQPQTAGLKPTTRPQAFIYTDPEQVTGDVTLSAMSAGRPAVTTVQAYTADVKRDLAAAMLNRRLRNLVAAGKAPFREAGVDVGTFLDEAATADASASGEAADWKPMLTALVAEIDRAVEHGFSDAELKLIEKGLLADAEQAVRTESTQDAVSLVNGIARDIGMNRPLLSAQQELDLLKQTFKNTSASEISTLFRESFDTKNFNYIVELPADKPGLTKPSAAEVLAVADAAWSATTVAPADTTTGAELLASQPTPGTVADQNIDDDLKIANVTFANGVVMHHKFSDYKKDTVFVSLTLPGGQLEETADNVGISEFAGSMLDAGKLATGRFTSTQLADLLTGKNIGLDGGIGRDSMSLQLTASKADLPTGMQLVYAVLTDVKVEQAAVEDQKKKLLQAIIASEKQPQGQLRKAVAKTIYGDEARFRPQTPADVNRITRDAAQAWLERITKSSAIEVAVVGDISLEDATKLVAQYVGSLPKRAKGFDALDGLRTVKRGAGPFEASLTFDSVTPKAVALGGFITCDELSPDRRPLALAAEVMTERMIKRIREKEQLVYSIGARNGPSRGVPGTGVFQAASMTDPKNGVKLADTINEMFVAFSKDGPTDDELNTAKKQMITEITTSMREPAWWLGQIAEMKYRGRQLSDLKNLPGVFDTFSAADVKNVVAKYLRPETMVRLVATPNSVKPTSAPATKPAE